MAYLVKLTFSTTTKIIALHNSNRLVTLNTTNGVVPHYIAPPK